MTVRFTAHTSHPWALRGWINVTVHDTVQELHRAAARFSGEDHKNTEACFQPTPYHELVNPDGTGSPVPGQWYGGVLRLTPDADTRIVAHECVHAAVSIYRHTYSLVCDLGDDCGGNEETFAYVLGDLIGVVTERMYALGVWPASDRTGTTRGSGA